MKAAVLGPIVKDLVTIDDVTKTQAGGIPYYQGTALKHLGVDVTAFITSAPEDYAWVEQSLHDVPSYISPFDYPCSYSNTPNRTRGRCGCSDRDVMQTLFYPRIIFGCRCNESRDIDTKMFQCSSLIVRNTARLSFGNVVNRYKVFLR